MTLSRVDLPMPESPTTAMYSPAATSSETSFRTVRSAEALGDTGKPEHPRIVAAHTVPSAFDDWVDQIARVAPRDPTSSPTPRSSSAPKFADRLEPEIAFGRYAGERRWESLGDVPAQEIKDELLKLIVSQADSEVRAVEQARELSTARRPSTTANGSRAT